MASLKVIFEDNHLLVVDKPPLIATMGARAGEDSLHLQAQEYIRHKFKKPGNVYIGVVSRIDSFVSGVIVLARTSKAASRLSDQFRKGEPEKTYWAMISAADATKNQFPETGNLEDRLVKNDVQKRMVVIPEDAKNQAQAKLAKLRYRTIGKTDQHWLLEVNLETGRKHQIRVQLENAGCPIIGDRKYGSKRSFRKGIALHSRKLVIQHPTKKVLQSFESVPPSWWHVERFSIS